MPVIIPPDIERRIDSLERNDPDEAEAIAEALVYAIGHIPQATAHYLLMMQDDAANLEARLNGRPIRPDGAEVR